VKAVKEELRRKRESKYLTTLWVILDYIVYFRNNGIDGEYPGIVKRWNRKQPINEEEIIKEYKGIIVDEELYLCCRDNTDLIDGIQAIALYLLMSFDWKSCKDVVSDYKSEKNYYQQKNPSLKYLGNSSQRGNDLLPFILRTLDNTRSSSKLFFNFNRKINSELFI